MLELARVDQPLENIKLLSYIFMLSPRTFLVRLLLIILKLIQVLDIANVEVQVTASVYCKLSLNLSLRYNHECKCVDGFPLSGLSSGAGI